MTLDMFLSVAGFVVALIGGAWALIKVVVAQFEKRLDERFAAQEKARVEARQQWDNRFSKIENQQDRLERDILTLRAELPREYVRREDAIRSETVTGAKLDALNARLETLITKRPTL